MSAWLVSIAAVVALSVLLDIIVPEGETNKYIKGIFAVITVFVIASPLVGLLTKSFTLTDFIGDSYEPVTVNESFIDKTVQDTYECKEQLAEAMLQNSGYNNAEVRIYLNYEDLIDYVTVNIDNLSIDSDVPHINISDNIKELVSGYLDIDEERVHVYGSYSG